MGVSSSKDFLQKRVEYLEEVNRKITNSLEVVIDLANFKNKIGNEYERTAIFSESTEKILELIDFKAIAFLLYDVQNYEFTIEHLYPQFLKSDFLVEVDKQIENGSFAWTLNQKGPVFVKPLQLDDSSELILHVLSTDKTVLGIFFGQLKVPKDEIFHESLELLTVALNTTSFAIENYKLYSEVAEHSKGLEKKVKEKTFDILQINEKLKSEIEIRKSAEQELKTHKVYFEALFNSSPVAVIALDNSFNIVMANPRFLSMFGYELDELIGHDINGLTIQEGKKEEQLWNEAARITQAQVETRHKRKDGSTIEVAISWSPLIINNAQVGVLAIYKDITERKLYEKSLKLAKELAEDATESKSKFLTNMSHEIRTPLNAILGMCELVMDTELDREQKDYVEVVRASSEGLFSIVNDVLDFSRLEEGKMKLDISEFNLRDLIEGVVDIFSLESDKKGIELLYQFPVGMALQVKGDVTRIRQILINLVANAIKFTKTGHVVIKVENGRIKKNSISRFKFVVEDTGIGIAHEHQEKVFEQFSLADNSLARKVGGAGLGLSIVKSLVQLMNGKLSLSSKPGEGCTFTIFINLQVLERESKTIVLKEFNNTILIVDKYEKSRKVLLEKLKSQNLKVVECTSQQRPLELIKSNKQITCIILNCANSMDLVKLVQKDSELDYVKMILIVSKSNLNNLKRIKDGIWLTKPIKEQQLFAAIDLVNKDLDTSEKALSLVEEPESRETVTPKVLLVEDNLLNQKTLKEMLKLGGYQVVLAENGEEAVNAVEENSFDAVIMDIQMPVMDGFEATEEIRKNEKSSKKKKVPIIALTAHAITGYKDKCLSAGIDDYLTKPVKKQILLDKIENWANKVTIIE